MDGGSPGHALVAATTRPWHEVLPVACWVRTLWGVACPTPLGEGKDIRQGVLYVGAKGLRWGVLPAG